MHDIERYGIGKSELATWRNAKRATLLFSPGGDMVMLTLLADEQLVGRHVVPAAQFAEVLGGYAHHWQAGAIGAQERSFVTAFGTKGQGVDTNLPPKHGPPKGYPAGNFLVHEQMRAFATLANQNVGVNVNDNELG